MLSVTEISAYEIIIIISAADQSSYIDALQRFVPVLVVADCGSADFTGL